MRICFRGNHQPDLPPDVPPWSTEAHLAASFEFLGHEVIRNHEQTDDWATTIRQAEGCDLFVWTSTWDFAERWPHAEAHSSIRYLNERVPTVAVHLDRWWELSRESQITDARRGNAIFVRMSFKELLTVSTLIESVPQPKPAIKPKAATKIIAK